MGGREGILVLSRGVARWWGGGGGRSPRLAWRAPPPSPVYVDRQTTVKTSLPVVLRTRVAEIIHLLV